MPLHSLLESLFSHVIHDTSIEKGCFGKQRALYNCCVNALRKFTFGVPMHYIIIEFPDLMSLSIGLSLDYSQGYYSDGKINSQAAKRDI